MLRKEKTIMNRKLVIFFTLCFILSNRVMADSATNGKSILPFKCSIEATKGQFKIGEPIEVLVSIENISDAKVNLAFWGRGKFPIVNFHIAVNGVENPFSVSTKQEPWCGTGVDNKSISPGQEYRFSVDLNETWEWGGQKTTFTPGIYTISAEIFRDNPDGSSPIVGKSKPIKLRIIKD
jgi:hypothetical protein